jgi:hypothetical protein
MPFTPKGALPQWQVVFRLFQQANAGQVITWPEIAAALGVDPHTDRGRMRAPARKAMQQMLLTENRAVEPVRGQGYRVVTAEQQIPLAGAQIERAARALDRGEELATHIRLGDLNPDGQAIVKTMALGFAQVAIYARQITTRIADHEGRLQAVETELERLNRARQLTFHPPPTPPPPTPGPPPGPSVPAPAPPATAAFGDGGTRPHRTHPRWPVPEAGNSPG